MYMYIYMYIHGIIWGNFASAYDVFKFLIFEPHTTLGAKLNNLIIISSNSIVP